MRISGDVISDAASMVKWGKAHAEKLKTTQSGLTARKRRPS